MASLLLRTRREKVTLALKRKKMPTKTTKKKMAKKKKRAISSYAHDKTKRANNPPVGLVNPKTDPDTGKKQTYQHDPHIDPQLQWASKAEHTSFEVPTQSLHVHERIDPRTIIEAVRKRNGDNGQHPSLFEKERGIPLRHAIEFYKHSNNWSNRLIAGDSLLIMNSLLQKENMASKVQCIYIDPPYGIKYGSNFQPFINKREVRDSNDEDLTSEPETIKAFRDTWELGIHSYLTHMRDRLLLAKELLTDSGSCFVQIGDENVHRVGLVMDDVFGAENRIATITYTTSGSSSAATLPQVADYLLWYAKDKSKIKYHQPYETLTRRELLDLFSWHAMVELQDGTCRKLTDEEQSDPDKFLPKDSRLFRRMPLQSQGHSTTGRSEPYKWNGRTFPCTETAHWAVSVQGMDRLSKLERLTAPDTKNATLSWKRYEEETPGRRLNNVWARQMSAASKNFVVQTATEVIKRCILMTTDPGDLVFDPTCGSGTTAYVAEQWGRRWITCDTSRVATTLAKQRLMTATFDYYKLAYPDEGVRSGFVYKKVPYVSAAALAYDEPQSFTTIFDQPETDTKRARVTGPFTVEAVPAPTVQPVDNIETPPTEADEAVARSGETLRQSEWRDELLKTGIRGKSGQRISFSHVEPLPCRWLHTDAETRPDDSGKDGAGEAATAYKPQRVVISFGPEHAPLEQRQVEHALQEAEHLRPKPEIIVFAAFQFDPEAAKDIDEVNWGEMTILKAQMNADLQTSDLKRKRSSNESFLLVGSPDIKVEQIQKGESSGQLQVYMNGFDYFNTKTGEIESGDEKRVAVWMLDTDYDGRSLYPSQVFFPMANTKHDWTKLAKNLKAEIDEELIEAYKGTVSLPFELGKNKRVAVKIVDDRGIESLKVVDIKATR